LFTGCSKEDPVPEEEGKVIVLMYHRITDGESSNLYERNATDFESDLKYLIYNNINVISFSDLGKIKVSGKMPAGHSAIISFDDGDHSWYTTAMPLLRKYRMCATFFLWTSMVGHDSFLKWHEITYMSNITLPGGIRPFTFGSHSCSHQYLQTLRESFSAPEEYYAYLDYEFGISKALIESHTPVPVSVFSLPFGDGAGDQDIIAAARRNGYSFVRTSVWGAIENTGFDLYSIPSLPMLDTTSPDEIGYFLNN
jgi:peptidoglycan/xylan/chitin deacetylase (PgdA/CDA1 family)